MKNFKLPAWVYLGFGIITFGMMYVVVEWEWNFLVSPMLFALGVMMIGIGVESAIARRANFTDSEAADYQMYRTYTGLAAVAFGLSFVFFGLLLWLGAVVNLLGMWEPFWGYLQAHPGWLFGAVGIGLFLGSVQGVLGYQEEKAKAWLFLMSAPRRLFSLFGILLSILLVLLGAFNLLFPAGYQALLDSLLPELSIYQ